jgi:hypothetical protein
LDHPDFVICRIGVVTASRDNLKQDNPGAGQVGDQQRLGQSPFGER